MLALSAVTHIYLYRSACDMRRSFDGLCGLIRSELRADPLSGSLFVFCNRRRTMVKILYFEGDGLAIWMKRLERGCFRLQQRAALDGEKHVSTVSSLVIERPFVFLHLIEDKRSKNCF